MSGAQGGQKKMLEPLEPKLQKVVGHHVGEETPAHFL